MFTGSLSSARANRGLCFRVRESEATGPDGAGVGFVSGVEMRHPDKDAEMFVYELGVDEAWRRRGIAKALLLALRDVAVQLGCRGMWTGTERDNAAALATYRRSAPRSTSDRSSSRGTNSARPEILVRELRVSQSTPPDRNESPPDDHRAPALRDRCRQDRRVPRVRGALDPPRQQARRHASRLLPPE
ncbi:N-acetyltransferase [Agromyces sp. Root81]|uniref:GNAT family N-acetyltransferase n=1 Tax=Agromyces sp. Root81 TaxID=1736601 RepID=UPI001F2CCEF7|nr:GNAT family N-acetyltransferase [Agromyces sp. Root81]